MTSSQDWGLARRIGFRFGIQKREDTWRYSRPTPDRLVIDGVHLGRSLHVALHRAPSLLMTRGFHWINEVPFHR
jgi:hypothetical protein